MSTFFTIEDFETSVKAVNLQQFAGGLETTLAVNTAIQYVSASLGNLYDTAAIFAETGGNRNLVIVDLVRIIALYKLFQRLPGRTHPDWLQTEYSEANMLLEKISKGDVRLEAPRRPNEDLTNTTRRRTGSIDSRRAE